MGAGYCRQSLAEILRCAAPPPRCLERPISQFSRLWSEAEGPVISEGTNPFSWRYGSSPAALTGWFENPAFWSLISLSKIGPHPLAYRSLLSEIVWEITFAEV